MQMPPEISFRDVAKTDATETLILEQIEKLELICGHLVSARIAVEQPQRHQRTGSPYRVRLALRLPPGHEIVVRHEPGEGGLHDQLETVLRSVFDSARRQLRQLVEQQRGEVKSNPEMEENAGIIARLLPDYGFLRAVDGTELYFHRNSVVNDRWDDLSPGLGVRFVRTDGLKGPRASTVQVVERPGSAVARAGETGAEPPLPGAVQAGERAGRPRLFGA